MPIDHPFLWALNFRTGGLNTNIFSLYFTAGYNHQMDGLFGEIAPTPEPGTITLLLAAAGSLGAGKPWLIIERELTPEAFSQRPMSHTSKSRMCGTLRLIPVKKSNLPPMQPQRGCARPEETTLRKRRNDFAVFVLVEGFEGFCGHIT